MKTENAMKIGSEHGAARLRIVCSRCRKTYSVSPRDKHPECPYCKRRLP